jgi:hypothetical protein
MSFWTFWRLAEGATVPGPRPGPIRRRRWKVDVDEFGYADCEVVTGDIDGSGETPGIQLEIQHDYTDGPRAIALSAREAELIGRALQQAAATIKPSERLRARRRKWHVVTEEGGEQKSTLQPRGQLKP